MLGMGSMGTVYLCRSVDDLNHLVALKEINPAVFGSQSGAISLARFRNEIAVLLSINHPNVVRIFEYLSAPGLAAYTMEYVPGGDLASYLRQHHTIALHEAVRILIQICAGVEAIAEAGITHRDLKPSNILLTDKRDVKIADFGIAKAETGPRLTAKGGVVGTIEYLSPQYLESGEVGPQGDVYAIGVMAFEMLTGQTPFAGHGILKTVELKVSASAPSIKEFIPECPGWLAEAITKALAAKKEDRFQNARELAAALIEGRERYGIPTPLRQQITKSREPPSAAPTMRRRRSLFNSHTIRLVAGGITFGIMLLVATVPFIEQGAQSSKIAALNKTNDSAPIVNQNSTAIISEPMARVSAPGDINITASGSSRLSPALVSPKIAPIFAELREEPRTLPDLLIHRPTKVGADPNIKNQPPAPKLKAVKSSAPVQIESERIRSPEDGPTIERLVFSDYLLPKNDSAVLSVEGKIKATLLYRFSDYVQWPSQPGRLDSAIRLCLFKDAAMAAQLENTLSRQQTRDGRGYNILNLKSDTPAEVLRKCDILYAGEIDDGSTMRAVRSLKGSPVLTVADEGDTAIINFVNRDEKVKFTISAEKAQEAGILIGSVLVDLALKE
jgi:serine/threonine protein kinase